jgi:hypothetical protein
MFVEVYIEALVYSPLAAGNGQSVLSGQGKKLAYFLLVKKLFPMHR